VSLFDPLLRPILRLPPPPDPPSGCESAARVFRAAPNYLKLLYLKWVIQGGWALILALVAPVALMAGGPREKSQSILNLSLTGEGYLVVFFLGFVLIGAFFRLLTIGLEYENRWYVVSDRSLRIREGVVIVREKTVTFANIQDLSVTQGPLQRMLGLSDLRVTTAGGGAVVKGQQSAASLHETWFRGIDNAEEIKDLIQRRQREIRDSGLGDGDDASEASEQPPRPIKTVLAEVLDAARGLRQAASR
jgi:membrane protein YdbS with pleckstrin-like domain